MQVLLVLSSGSRCLPSSSLLTPKSGPRLTTSSGRFISSMYFSTSSALFTVNTDHMTRKPASMWTIDQLQDSRGSLRPPSSGFTLSSQPSSTPLTRLSPSGPLTWSWTSWRQSCFPLMCWESDSTDLRTWRCSPASGSVSPAPLLHLR